MRREAGRREGCSSVSACSSVRRRGTVASSRRGAERDDARSSRSSCSAGVPSAEISPLASARARRLAARLSAGVMARLSCCTLLEDSLVSSCESTGWVSRSLVRLRDALSGGAAGSGSMPVPTVRERAREGTGAASLWSVSSWARTLRELGMALSELSSIVLSRGMRLRDGGGAVSSGSSRLVSPLTARLLCGGLLLIRRRDDAASSGWFSAVSAVSRSSCSSPVKFSSREECPRMLRSTGFLRRGGVGGDTLLSDLSLVDSSFAISYRLSKSGILLPSLRYPTRSIDNHRSSEKTILSNISIGCERITFAPPSMSSSFDRKPQSTPTGRNPARVAVSMSTLESPK